jgi:hypothetical protein
VLLTVHEVIREAISFSIATKGLTPNTRAIKFIREGASTKTTNKPFSILDKAPDGIILMYRYEKQYKIPGDLVGSSSRPDIYSRKKNRVQLIELIIPWEKNIPKNHAIKLNRYYELTNELIKNNYSVNFYALEVGARGIPAKSLYNLLKDISSALERVSKAALLDSYRIWLGREGNVGSRGER